MSESMLFGISTEQVDPTRVKVKMTVAGFEPLWVFYEEDQLNALFEQLSRHLDFMSSARVVREHLSSVAAQRDKEGEE